MAPATTTSVQVALRIRPITPQDAISIPARFQRIVIHESSDTAVIVDAVASTPSGATSGGATAPPTAANKKQAFTFDNVINPDAGQYHVYATTAEPLLARFLEGFNCTILAYGQTSSGKTHTMTGIDLDADPTDPENGMGIIPRSIAEIFSRINEVKKEERGAWDATVKGSFIEIYNEDLIDLLSIDDPNARREVQIREDKDGHIIWGGLREVPVKNVGEVMTLIRQGTSIRRTNETQMNAQSSRSHAIFSLTLTQKKYTGAGNPPRSGSPGPGQASPSRMTRPGSLYSGNSGRVGSPTFGRPPTPSFQTAMHRGSQTLRPHSSLGHSEDDRTNSPMGEYTTIVSKFHFVDLAGSERLKRTAAAGDRIKEGISINSGLLALGNVISALGDPSKARTTTHIPYRDSKLTRLLQDSLGGNAHTLMIACVSPVEWNVGETVNTLKYANRARNIRNRVRIDEREEGWEDVEWLQTTVTRLRKEMRSLRDGGALPSSESTITELGGEEGLTSAGKQVREQLADLQTQYVELRQKFTERTEELTRLRRVAGENLRRSGGSIGAGTGRYEEIVGPVIEEYEKTITSMEAELSLNRAALRHTNDLLTEKEDELSAEAERHAVAEAYVEELRARVAKVTEREGSTEAYIQDLEEKIKGVSSTSVTTSESLSAIQKELARQKDLEGTNSAYIIDLEARLAKSEESVLTLRNAVVQAENTSEKRMEEMHLLELRVNHMRGDESGWRSDLESREERVRALEAKMKLSEKAVNDVAFQREKLGGLVLGVEDAKRSLEDVSKASTPQDELLHSRSGINGESGLEVQLQDQLRELQETHTATLADLSVVTDKYRDALREISDLATQLQEAKYQQSSHSAATSLSDPAELVDSTPHVTRRRKPSSQNASADSSPEHTSPILNGNGRRPFFKQAASAESLRTRSLSQSLSLSQELSSARSLQRSITPQTIRHQRSESLITHSNSLRSSLSLSGPQIASSTGNSERTIFSLEQEIMRLQEVLKEREVEINKLEEALHKRGDSISRLPLPDQSDPHELSPLTMDHFSALRTSIIHELPDDETDSGPASKRPSLGRLDELMRSMAQKESHHKEVVENLTSELMHTQRQYEELTTLSRDQAVNMSNELEALRQKNDSTIAELEAMKERESQLLTSSDVVHREQLQSSEQLRDEFTRTVSTLETELQRLKADITASQHLQDELAAAKESLKQAQLDHDSTESQMKASHLQECSHLRQEAKRNEESLTAAHAAELLRLKEEHDTRMLESKGAAADLQKRTDEEYYIALSKFRSQHEEELRRHEEQSTQDLERLRTDHEAHLRQSDMARQGVLADSQAAQSESLRELQTDYHNTVNRKQEEHDADLQRAKEAHTRLLDTKENEHSETVNRLRSDHASALSKLNDQLSAEVTKLSTLLAEAQREHKVALSSLRQALEGRAEEIANEKDAATLQIRKEHEHSLQKLSEVHEGDIKQHNQIHDSQISDQIRQHEQQVKKVEIDHEQQLGEMSLAKEAEHMTFMDQLKQQHAQILANDRSRHTEILQELQATTDRELEDWRKKHDMLIEENANLNSAANAAVAAHKAALDTHVLQETARNRHVASLENDIAKVRVQHQTASDQLATLTSEKSDMHGKLSRLRQDAEAHGALTEELRRVRLESDGVKDELQGAKRLCDSMAAEKSRHENMIRDLQAQLSLGIINKGLNLGNAERMERTVSYPRTNGLPPAKLPPLSPPPSIPPPPLPTALPLLPSDMSHGSMSSVSTHGRHSSGSQDTHDTAPTPTTSVNGSAHPEELSKLQSHARLIEEQEVMIKTLNKQLSHCEGDLQSHIDLVATLERSLNDSERNLRKARNQATELSRDRDALNRQMETARNEARDSQRELATARQSVIEQKQSLEQRLDEERKAKERTRAQLDARMEELQRRKSKFACM